MDFASPSVKARRSIIQGCRRSIKLENQSDENNHNLNMYLNPSSETISLLEFQQLGLDRLAVLRKIETLKERYGSNKEEHKREYIKEIGELMPLAIGSCSADKLAEARRHDRISHFILRLAFCQSMDLSDWFVKQETELFRWRFQFEPISSVINFLRLNNFALPVISVAEKQEIASDLTQSLTMSVNTLHKMEIFKVPFEEVLELLITYRCYLRGGFAYITVNDLIALVAPRFRINIQASMAYARRHIGFLHEEDRIIPLLRRFTTKSAMYGGDFKQRGVGDVTPDMVDELAKTSFPLCMRTIHFNFRHEHHLKHFARRQYGLFLQGIGMSMENALEFFRREFSQRINSEKFNKEYAYNIRHMYGKEGKREVQKPLSCPTIILGNAPTGPQDCHGCPYRHMEETTLRKKLESLGLNAEHTKKILEYAKTNRFDKACTHYFEVTHKMEEGSFNGVIVHPNQYFNESRSRLAPSQGALTNSQFGSKQQQSSLQFSS